MSEMLTEMVPGQEDSSDLELLQVRGGMSLSCGSSGPGDPAVRQEQGPGDYCGKGLSPYRLALSLMLPSWDRSEARTRLSFLFSFVTFFFPTLKC